MRGQNAQEGKTAQKRANMRESREHRQLELSRSSQLGVSEAVSRPSVSREVTAANIT